MNELSHLLYDSCVLKWISPKKHMIDIIIKNGTETARITDWMEFYTIAARGFNAYLDSSGEKGLNYFCIIMKRLFIRDRIYFVKSRIYEGTKVHKQISNIINNMENSDIYPADTLVVYINLPHGSNVSIYQLGMLLWNLKKEYKYFKRFITRSSTPGMAGHIIVALGMNSKIIKRGETTMLI